MFNVNGAANKAGQISEVVNVVLQYKIYLEQMLLAVSSLGKQDLILGFLWLKDHNLEVNWEKEEIEMTCCSPRCDGYKDFWKIRRVEEQTIAVCWSRLFPWVSEEDEELDMTIEYERLGGEPEDRMFLMYIFLEKFSANIWAAATTSQRLSETFWKSTAADKKLLPLSSYTQGFEFVFVKEDWCSPRTLSVGLCYRTYSWIGTQVIQGVLSLMEQVELDIFLSENLKTGLHLPF